VIRRQSLLAVAATSLAASFFAPVAGAQEPGVPIYPVSYRALVGLNPLGIPFDLGALEVEGVVGPGLTLGGAASYSAVGDDDGDGEGDPRFASGDVKVRYYPGEVALRGFSIGLALGLTRYSENRSVGTPATLRRQAMTAPTISVLADYNFLLGARQRFVVGTGIGAKRLLASEEDRDRTGAPRAYPFVRFVLGIAF
jgi:hypothetical protein